VGPRGGGLTRRRADRLPVAAVRAYLPGVELGAGVYVGPPFIVFGVLIILLRRPLGAWLARHRPGAELAGPDGAVGIGASSILAGGLGLLAGLDLLPDLLPWLPF